MAQVRWLVPHVLKESAHFCRRQGLRSDSVRQVLCISLMSSDKVISMDGGGEDSVAYILLYRWVDLNRLG